MAEDSVRRVCIQEGKWQCRNYTDLSVPSQQGGRRSFWVSTVCCSGHRPRTLLNDPVGKIQAFIW